MTDINTLEAIAMLLDGEGGERFCRGYIDAEKGQMFSMPSMNHDRPYTRGFIARADRIQLELIAEVVMPNDSLSKNTDSEVREYLLRFID